MTARISMLVSLVALALVGCTADIHDNDFDIEDVSVDFDTDIDVDDVTAGDSIPITIDAENVVLVNPSEEPPPDQVDVAGHFEIFLDDENSAPLLVTAETSVDVTIPVSTPEGDHDLICRVVKHDGTPTDAVFHIQIKVKASVSTG